MNSKGKKLAVIGTALQLGPVFGLTGTAIGMLSAFRTMDSDGSTHSEAMAGDIGFALITTAIGLVSALTGFILILIALFGSKYRAPWFFWFLTVWSVLWMFNFPAGTFLGIGLLIYLITHQKEFKKKTEPEVGGSSLTFGS